MSKKNKLWLVLGIFFTILLSGCKCSNVGVEAFIVFPDLPIGGDLVSSLTPLFDWHGSDSCDPDYYSVYIREDVPYGANTAGADVDYTDVPYTLSGDSLLPGRAYYWTARARNHYESSEDPGALGPESAKAYFFTGPVCSGNPLIAPELEYPRDHSGNEEFDNWITHDHHQDFHWSYSGGCLPVSYDYQFALDAGFTEIVLSETTTEPYVQHIFEPFSNCSSLFWRVRANDGTSVGPWSDAWQFHWVREGTDCYQTHYISDDFAWIRVSVLKDYCDQTGEIAAWTATLNPGCMVDGMIIVGDGTYFSGTLKDVVVDLGAGSCPSTGLDQKTAEYSTQFGVLTPGTYCVTVSRNQTVDYNGPINMMDGIWTGPRTNQILVQETIDFGPGNHDYIARFAWDEIDRTFLTLPLDYTYGCKYGPEDICPTYDFAMKGDFIPIFARAANSDYKLTELNGVPCYIHLENAAINEALGKFEAFDWRAEDLPIFPQPDPCPKPASRAACSSYSTQASCPADCTWHPPSLAAGFCSDN